MRDDLLDAYGAVDWARSQFPAIQEEFKTWLNAPSYELVSDPHPETRKKLLKLKILRPLTPSLNSWAGAAVNSIRTGLDLLAAALATRNGVMPGRNTHFPIYDSFERFSVPESVAKRKKWLSAADLQIIEALRPYKGGNDLLFALHQLDVRRKHERLLKVDLNPSMIVVAPEAYAQGFRFPTHWPGFTDGAVIGSTSIDATNSDFEITTYVTFDEADLIPDKPIITTLREFASLTDSIIKRFE